ncbi:MAG: hypothetical protein O3A63_21730 [Proteobacteria bacterium]|nr:hypothetical protein [Pseudomonadota bacterium]
MLVAWVVILGLVVLSVMRQIGVLHERSAPAGDLLGVTLTANKTEGLPDISILRLDGERIKSETLTQHTLILLFVAPECQVCKPLVRVFGKWIEKLAHTHNAVGYFVTSAAAATAKDYAQKHDQPFEHWLISERLGLELNARQTPWLVVMREGRLQISQKIANQMQLDRTIDSVLNTALHTNAAQSLKSSNTSPPTAPRRGEQHGLA